MKRPYQAGFTITEILIVVAMIGLLCAIAIPNFVQARNRSKATACINNLRQITAAVQQWATEQNQGYTATVSSADVTVYLGGHSGTGVFPHCPAGGAYQLTTVEQPPTCSLQGTITPDHILLH